MLSGHLRQGRRSEERALAVRVLWLTVSFAGVALVGLEFAPRLKLVWIAVLLLAVNAVGWALGRLFAARRSARGRSEASR